MADTYTLTLSKDQIDDLLDAVTNAGIATRRLSRVEDVIRGLTPEESKAHKARSKRIDAIRDIVESQYLRQYMDRKDKADRLIAELSPK